jgi:hypothetical protein
MATKKRHSDADSEYRSGVSKRRISVTIEGTADGGAPTLNEFLKQLEAVKVALKQTERAVTGTDEPDVRFKIVGLSMKSPATVVLEEIPVVVAGKRKPLPRTAISERFVSTLNQINTRGTVPAKIRELSTLEAYRSVGAAARYGAITIASADRRVEIAAEFDQKVERIIGPDQVFEGSVTGVLLAINLHNTTQFAIYPPVGPPKVACTFPAELKKRVIEGIDRNVRVVGKLRYKHWAPFPHAITAQEIQVYPPADELPTLESLYGLATREQEASQRPPHDGQ